MIPQPIPPIWFTLFSNILLLRDESAPISLITSLDFLGDHVSAAVVEGRGVVVIKNENPIGSDAPSPAYLSSHGSFTTPLNNSTTQFLVHTVDESHNFSVLSGTMIVPAVSGLYATTLIVNGETTSDICTVSPPASSVFNLENKVFNLSANPARYQGSTIQQSQIPKLITHANCYEDNKMLTEARGLFFLTAGTHRVMVHCGVIPAPFVDPPPPPIPSSAGTFTFTIQRVSKGS